MDKTYLLFLLQIVMPFVGLYILLFYFSPMWFIISCVIFFLMRSVGVVMTYHRVHCHKTHTMTPLVEFICTGLGFYGSLSSPIEFCASHQDHHKYMDTPKDPHSPKYLGLKAMFPIFWVGRGSGDLRTIVRLSKNRITKFYHDYYWYLLPLPFLLLLISLNAFLFLFVLPTSMTLVSLSISVLNHDDNGPKQMSKLYGVLTGGEHVHKWHHEHATDTSQEGLVHYILNILGTENRRIK